MPCCLIIGVLAFPRIVLVCLFLFSTYLERAYHGLIIPILGFILLPLTTITYAWLVNTHQPIQGFNLMILIVAVLLDAGGIGGGALRRRD
jgi:hypothetical protein